MTLLTVTGCVVASIVLQVASWEVQIQKGKADCVRACNTFVRVKDKHEACLSGCLNFYTCLYSEIGDEQSRSYAHDVCMLNCKRGCDEQYEKLSPQAWSCRVGCSSLERLSSDGILPAQDYINPEILSDTPEQEYSNVKNPVGIVQETTQNISLTLGGVVKTDVKSSSLLTPLQVDSDTTTSEKNIQEAKNISIDVQGLIGNVSKHHKTVTDYGEKGSVTPEEKRREEAENISLAILGSINRTGYGTEVVTKRQTGEEKTLPIGVEEKFAIKPPKVTKPRKVPEVKLEPKGVGKIAMEKKVKKVEEKGGKKGKGKEKTGEKGKGKGKVGGMAEVKPGKTAEVKPGKTGKVKVGETRKVKPGEKVGAKAGEKGKGKKKEEKGKEKGAKGKGKGGEKGKEKVKVGGLGAGKEKVGGKGKEMGKKGKEGAVKKGKEAGKGKKKEAKPPVKTPALQPPPAVGPAPAVKPK